MDFRRLTLAEIESLDECRKRALASDNTAFLVTLEEHELRGPNAYAHVLEHTGNEKAIFGAIENGRVVGMVGISFGEKTRDSHRALIWGMYVDASQRGKGAGGKILDLALEFARAKTDAVVTLSVTEGNETAKKLYVSRGFRIWGTEPASMRIDGVDYDEHHMSLVMRRH